MTLEFHSKRLTFRPLALNDLDLMVALWRNPNVARYTDGKTSTSEELSAKMPLVTRRCAGGSIGMWALSDTATQTKIGTASLLPMPVDQADKDWDLITGDSLPDADIEIGYILRQSAWGQGFATEACARLLQFAFEHSLLTQVMANIDPNNTASQNVLLKCGFSPIGLIRAYNVDVPGFCITKRDWRRASRG